jgi:uncharacterized protein (TIGR02246 family)
MRRTILAPLLLSLTACAGGLLGGSEDPPGGRNSDDEVRAFFMTGIDAFNAHELNRFMGQFGADIRMYTPTGWVNGYAAVRERFAGTLEQFPQVRMEIDSLRVRQVRDDVVVTEFQWRVFPMGQGPAFHGVGSGVYVLRGSKWEEVLEHETVTRVDEALR